MKVPILKLLESAFSTSSPRRPVLERTSLDMPTSRIGLQNFRSSKLTASSTVTIRRFEDLAFLSAELKVNPEKWGFQISDSNGLC